MHEESWRGDSRERREERHDRLEQSVTKQYSLNHNYLYHIFTSMSLPLRTARPLLRASALTAARRIAIAPVLRPLSRAGDCGECGCVSNRAFSTTPLRFGSGESKLIDLSLNNIANVRMLLSRRYSDFCPCC